MTLEQLLDRITAAQGSTPDRGLLVKVIDKNSGLISGIEEVKLEHHDDGDGSFTLWLVTEES